MAILHVNSGNGAPTAPYETWAKAANTLAVAATASAAGDTIYVHPSHSETSGWSITLPGTKASPSKVVCGTPDTVSGITALATGAIVSHTGTNFVVGCAYLYGIDFKTTGSGSATMSFGNATGTVQFYENCGLLKENTEPNTDIVIGSSSSIEGTLIVLRNCTWRLSHASQQIRINDTVIIEGGSFHASHTENINGVFLLSLGAKGSNLQINGMDMSEIGNTANVVQHTGSQSVACARIRNCKMPASWTGTLTSAALSSSSRVELLNYGTGDTNYKFWVEDVHGIAKDESTIKILASDGGATDGVNNYSMRLQTTANCAYPSSIFRSPPIVQRVNTVGGAVTATVEVVHDGASPFTDKEIWLEVEYLGTSGFPLSSRVSDVGGFVAAAAAQASSSNFWDGDTGTGPNGSSTWNKIKLVTPSFTPQEQGYIVATVCMGVASKTAFVDPVVLVA